MAVACFWFVSQKLSDESVYLYTVYILLQCYSDYLSMIRRGNERGFNSGYHEDWTKTRKFDSVELNFRVDTVLWVFICSGTWTGSTECNHKGLSVYGLYFLMPLEQRLNPTRYILSVFVLFCVNWSMASGQLIIEDFCEISVREIENPCKRRVLGCIGL
jgi:hypothetical protein